MFVRFQGCTSQKTLFLSLVIRGGRWSFGPWKMFSVHVLFLWYTTSLTYSVRSTVTHWNSEILHISICGTQNIRRLCVIHASPLIHDNMLAVKCRRKLLHVSELWVSNFQSVRLGRISRLTVQKPSMFQWNVDKIETMASKDKAVYQSFNNISTDRRSNNFTQTKILT